MPTRLSGLDASFLYLETRSSHMHVASAVVLDPSTRPGGELSCVDFKGYVASRLHLLPPFRRRLVPVPLRLDHPQWIEDPDFDLDYHIRRAALPAPGGMRELADFAADFMSRPLDRERPLWEVWFVEGLEGGRIAVLSKTHHAAVDGVSGAELLAAVLQVSPDQQPPDAEEEWRPEQPPGDLRLLASAGLRFATRPWLAAKVGRRLLRAAPSYVKLPIPGRRRDADGPPAPFSAPQTIFNGAIGPHRRICLTEVDLAAVKDVKNALGGTVNDVVLTAVTGGVRRYLQHRGEPVDEPLVGMVPISTRGATGQEGGNSVSAMLVGLPVHLADPLEQLAEVSSGTQDAKEQHGALGAMTIQQLVELAPAGVSSLAARAYTRMHGADRHRPIWNLIVSNVPGPRIPLYYAGAKVEAMYPIGPVHEMSGLNITLFSYLDRIFFGINADRDMIDDVDRLGDFMVEAVGDLAKLADAAAP